MDPLAQLRDIHLPEPISIWPPAPGWWVLVLLIVLCGVLATFYLLSHLRKNQYRRVALKQLNEIFERHKKENNSVLLANNINSLLKQVSVNYYKKSAVSKLSSIDWLGFLDNSAKTQDFTQGAGQVLATLPYKDADQVADSVDTEALFRCCNYWIRKHQ